MATNTNSRANTIPDEIKPKIPLQYSFPPELRVDEKRDGEWERNTYGVSPLAGDDGRLPPEAAKALLRFTGVPENAKKLNPTWIPGDASDYPDFGDGNPTVWMCDKCAERADQYGDRGYLTQQKACKVTERRTPSCSHTWEEEAYTGIGLGLEWGSEEAWGAEILLNGERAAPTAVDRDRQLIVSEYPEWDYTADPTDSTTVDIPDSGTKTVTRETNGKSWTVTITADETVSVEWERELPSGETLEGETGTEIREQECSGSSFTRVYPESKAREDEYLPLHEMDAGAFPNHPSHFGRIVNDQGLSGDQMVEQVRDALWEWYRTQMR